MCDSKEMRVPTFRLVAPYSYEYTPILRCEDQRRVQRWNAKYKTLHLGDFVIMIRLSVTRFFNIFVTTVTDL